MSLIYSFLCQEVGKEGTVTYALMADRGMQSFKKKAIGFESSVCSYAFKGYYIYNKTVYLSY